MAHSLTAYLNSAAAHGLDEDLRLMLNDLTVDNLRWVAVE